MPDLLTATVNLKAHTAQFKKETAGAFGGLRQQLRETKASFTALGIGAGILAGGITLIGKSAIDAAVQMDSLKRGLAAVAGGAEQAEAQMSQLREIAKLPGLGLKEAMEGATRLQAVGLSAEQANRSLMAFGNALARVGKGKAELDGVILALTQIIGKGKVSAEEINQIAERVPEVRKVMMEAFGTTSTEAIEKLGTTAEVFIEKLIVGFEKLPKVTGGVQNSIENFTDAVFEARVALGNALLPTFTALLGKLSETVTWLNNLSKAQQSMIAWSGAIIGGLAGITAALVGMGLALSHIIAGVKALGVVLTFLSAHPIVLAITAVAALTAGIVLLQKEINKEKQPIDEFAGSIVALTTSLSDTNKEVREAAEISLQQMTSGFSQEMKQIQARVEELKRLRETASIRPIGAPVVPYLHRTVIDEQLAELEKRGQELKDKLERLSEVKSKPIDTSAIINSIDTSAIINSFEQTTNKIRSILAENEAIRASLMKEGLEKELAILKVEYDAQGSHIDDDIAAIKGASQQEITEKQALVAQKALLEEKYQQDAQTIRDQYAQEAEAKEQKSLAISLLAAEKEQKKIRDEVAATFEEMKQIESDFAKKYKEDQEKLFQGFVSIGRQRIALIQDSATREKAEAWIVYQEKVSALQQEYDNAETITARKTQIEQEVMLLKQTLLAEYDKIDEKYAERQKERAKEVGDVYWKAIKDSREKVVQEQTRMLKDAEEYGKSIEENWREIIEKNVQLWESSGKKNKTVWKDFSDTIRSDMDMWIDVLQNVTRQMSRDWQQMTDFFVSTLRGGPMAGLAAWVTTVITAGQQFYAQRAARTGRPQVRPARSRVGILGAELQPTTVAGIKEPITQAGPAIQISAITGPTRDLLIDLLTPLRNLNILPSLMETMTRAIFEMRDAFLGKEVAPTTISAFAAAGGGIAIENVHINVNKAADAGDIEQLDRNLSAAVRREKRLLGRRG